jgi:hypothetical protein
VIIGGLGVEVRDGGDASGRLGARIESSLRDSEAVEGLLMLT